MSRQKEFHLGPEAARDLYNYGSGEKRLNKEGGILHTQGIGRKIGHGVYNREDVTRVRGEASGRQTLPMKLPPLAQPHEQSEEQFESDPRTWWHGKYQPAKDSNIHSGVGMIRDAGLHVGTKRAATERLDVLGPGSPEEPGKRMPGRLFAGRIHGRVSEKLADDTGSWAEPTANRLYENISEDRRSISAILKGRENFRTHQESIHEHLLSQKDPRAALAGLRPRVRAEYEARGGLAGRGTFEYTEGDRRAMRGMVGKQFSHTENYEHRDEVAERPKTHEQLSMFNTVRIGSSEKYLTPGEYGDLKKMLDGPPLMMKPGKAKKAF